MMGFAEFTIRQVDHGKRMIWIVDQGTGCTITNAADGVCKMLAERYAGYRIIYQDTDGYWDELVHADGVFKDFAPARELGLP